MEHRSSKKKKCGKCCCGNRTLIRKFPYATISNKTADDPLGAPIAITNPSIDQRITLWSAGFQPSQTCLNGLLKGWFDPTTGYFTLQESGLYTFTFTASFAATPQANGHLAVVLKYVNLVNQNKRCINVLLEPTDRIDFEGADPSTWTTTVSATLPLVVGDIVAFDVVAFQTVSTPVGVIAEIDVVQESRLVKDTIEKAEFI